MNGKEVRLLSDEQLAAVREAELDRLAPRARAHALAVAGGKTAAEAARELGMSTNGQVLARMKARTKVAIALLREGTRRKAESSAEAAARWFDDLAEEARRARDYSAAARAKREAQLLRNGYPDARLLVQHELLDTREVTAEEIEALSLLRHGVRRQLTGQVIEAEVTSIDGSPVTSAAQGIDITARALGADGKEATDAP